MGEGVPLAPCLGVDVVPHVVEADTAGLLDHVVSWISARGVQRRCEGAKRDVEGEGNATTHETSRRGNAARRHQIDEAELILRTEDAPCEAATAWRGRKSS